MVLAGPIEKGALDGQTQYAKDLSAALRAAVSKSAKTTKAGRKGALRRKKGGADTISPAMTGSRSSISGAASSSTSGVAGIWAAIEPLIGSPQGLVIAVLGAMVLALLWRRAASSSSSSSNPSHILGRGSGPGRTAAATYEQMWRGEEAELWRWIEERVGGHDGWVKHGPAWSSGGDKPTEKPASGSGKTKKKGAQSYDDLDGLGELEVGEAIRVTRQKLGVLEEMLKARRSTSGLNEERGAKS
jgi:hypothetical protein